MVLSFYLFPSSVTKIYTLGTNHNILEIMTFSVTVSVRNYVAVVVLNILKKLQVTVNLSIILQCMYANIIDVLNFTEFVPVDVDLS